MWFLVACDLMILVAHSFYLNSRWKLISREPFHNFDRYANSSLINACKPWVVCTLITAITLCGIVLEENLKAATGAKGGSLVS